jgi:hypothetical protein
MSTPPLPIPIIVLIALNGLAALMSLISLQIVEDWAAAAALVLLVFHIFAALGLTRRMDWARRSMNVYAVLGLIVIGIGVPYSLLNGREQPWGLVDGLVVLVSIVFAAFFVWVLIYLRKPEMKDVFQ